jgi:hypothetical protein
VSFCFTASAAAPKLPKIRTAAVKASIPIANAFKVDTSRIGNDRKKYKAFLSVVRFVILHNPPTVAAIAAQVLGLSELTSNI